MTDEPADSDLLYFKRRLLEAREQYDFCAFELEASNKALLRLHRWLGMSLVLRAWLLRGLRPSSPQHPF